MLKIIHLNGKSVSYDFQCKKVKNINLRIKPDGSISLSANRRVSQKVIEDFLCSKESFILNALEKIEDRKRKTLVRYFDDAEIRQMITALCQSIYPHFEKRRVAFPEIKFRKMKTQWGNCHPSRKILTFNTRLAYAPPECVEYVVAHEFAHFLQPNHSALFYAELEKVMPDWKERRRKLKNIPIV